jgi:hypothetical protein
MAANPSPRSWRWPAAGMLGALIVLIACAAPTEVVDLSVTPQVTLDAMLRVQILPLGVPGPPDVGSVGPILGYGCGSSTSGAVTDAVQQLQVKALSMQAIAVIDVLIAPTGPCYAGYGATARGTAVAASGLPRPW